MSDLFSALSLLIANPLQVPTWQSICLLPFNGTEWDLLVPEPAAPLHRELRAEVGADVPDHPFVALYGSAGHHSSVRFSLMITRAAGGRLFIDGVDERGPGLVKRPTVRTTFFKPLSQDEAESLSALLADPCLGEEPVTSYDRNIAVGGTYLWLEIEDAHHNRKMWTYGEVPGVSGQLVHLIFNIAQRAKREAKTAP